jgi:hypothetical protein
MLKEKLRAMEETTWRNPKEVPFAAAAEACVLTMADVRDAADRLERFRPYFAKVFPETAPAGGLVESPLRQIPKMQATLEDSCDWRTADARCSVRVFERYSYMGGNRVSMNVTLFQSGKIIKLCAITSGGSQAMFFKVNTWGEETFLDTLKDVVRHL